MAACFPQAIGMAAIFDTDMLYKIGDVTATEGRAKYNAYSARNDRNIYKGLTFWSPNINIFRDPRWGRGHETYLHLLSALKNGLVTEEEITQTAERLFKTRFLLGLFGGCKYDTIPYHAVECREHLQLAKEAALKSAVLSKNDDILPLKKEALASIAVIGPNANSRAALVENYHATPTRYITALEGAQDEAGDALRVYSSQGCHLKGTGWNIWPGRKRH